MASLTNAHARALVVLVAAVLAPRGVSAQQQEPRDSARPAASAEEPPLARERREARARAEASLRAFDPTSVIEYASAERALDARRPAEALAALDRAIARAPSSWAPHRLRCVALAQLRRRGDASEACARALELARSPEAESDARLTSALFTIGELDEHAPSPSERGEARLQVDRANAAAPGRAYTEQVRCAVALRGWRLAGEDADGLERCVSALAFRAPDSTPALYYGAWLALAQGDVALALDQERDLHARPLAPARRDELRQQIYEALPWYARAWSRSIQLLGAWALGWLVVVSLTALASALAARSSRSVARDERPSLAERAQRRAYRALLWLCCGYYFVSLPAVGLLVGVLVVTLVALLAHVRHFSWIVASLALSTVVATARALYGALDASIAVPDPGRRLRVDEHPAFAAALRDVAARVGTRAPDAVFLAPDTSVGITEVGSLLARLRGRSERRLVLGVGLLAGLTVAELSAILAHEHGHYRNEDSAGGPMALAVRVSLARMNAALRSTRRGYLSPAFWFGLGFASMFERLSAGASRLQETLADRVAARAFGGETSARALERTIERDVRFELAADAVLRRAADGSLGLTNLYEQAATEPLDEDRVRAGVERAMAHEDPHGMHRHPAPRERVERMRALGFAPPSPPDERPAWSLFDDRAGLEHDMTEELRAAFAQRFLEVLPTHATREASSIDELFGPVPP